MIQFNLLPDIKIQYLRARRQKRLVMLSSTIVIVVCVVVVVLLSSTVFLVQRKNIKDLSADIKAASLELQTTPNLTKMLTVQNQLKALPGLHDSKPVVNRLFEYIAQSTPVSANIARLSGDFGAHTLSISGAADTLNTVNTFADTLKFTTYHTEDAPKDEKRAFSDVVLASFGRDSVGASYTITFSFDPEIFSEQQEVTLTVPKIITTRSEIEQPSALFQQSSTPQEEQ